VFGQTNRASDMSERANSPGLESDEAAALHDVAVCHGQFVFDITDPFWHSARPRKLAIKTAISGRRSMLGLVGSSQAGVSRDADH
jgi:hypothetical protein